MLSIVIPTKNEEKYLPSLLHSIKRQTFTNYEIVVADNNSTDKTREIAQSFGCKVVDGGLPAVGRNRGFLATTGNMILFLDADTEILDENFLMNALQEIQNRKLAIAVPFTVTVGNQLDKLYFYYWNCFVMLAQFSKPLAGGWCIFTHRDLHMKIGGFNEKIILGEDTDYARRAALYGKFSMLKNATIQTSSRRLKKEGYVKVAYQSIGLGLYILTHRGKMDEKNIFGYEFDIYEK